MSRASPVPMLELEDAPPFINEGVPAPAPMYPQDPVPGPGSLDRSRTSMDRSTGSLHQLQPQDNGQDKHKTESGGGLGKLKGKFFKKKSKAPEVKMPDIHTKAEDPYESIPPTPKEYDPNPGGMTYNPSASLTRSAPPVSYASPSINTEIMVMNKPPPSSHCRSGNVLNGLLILGIIAGIILCACIAADSNLVYIGPVILGLSVFALCGKVFFTLFWEEDPLPFLNPYMEKMDAMIGGVKDPYNLRAPATTAAYLGPMYADTSTYQMSAFSYPRQTAPKMYDESIDARLRPMAPPTYDTSYSSSTPPIRYT